MFLLGFICGVIAGATSIIVIACSIDSGNTERQLEENNLRNE